MSGFIWKGEISGMCCKENRWKIGVGLQDWYRRHGWDWIIWIRVVVRGAHTRPRRQSSFTIEEGKGVLLCDRLPEWISLYFFHIIVPSVSLLCLIILRTALFKSFLSHTSWCVVFRNTCNDLCPAVWNFCFVDTSGNIWSLCTYLFLWLWFFNQFSWVEKRGGLQCSRTWIADVLFFSVLTLSGSVDFCFCGILLRKCFWKVVWLPSCVIRLWKKVDSFVSAVLFYQFWFFSL